MKPEVAPDRYWVNTLLQMIRLASDPDPTSSEPQFDWDATGAALIDGLECACCGELVEEPRAYCSDFCLEVAGIVRSVRRAIREGREKSRDYKIGLWAKLQATFQGGYPARERSLSSDQRLAIFERDNGTCQICGGPADQIDHIQGDSSDPANLRAICGPCNLERVLVSREVTPEERAAFQDWAMEICAALASRIVDTNVQFPCDDPDRWPALERKIRARRTRHFKQAQVGRA